jgi:ABC-type multidrug transport system fused ATPase/permease subunit
MSETWTKRRKIVAYLSPPVIRYLSVGILIGATFFCVEMAFAYSLQAFLVCLHIAPPLAATRMAGRLADLGVGRVLTFIFVVGMLRALLGWAQVFTQGAASEEFKYLQRSRILRWAFASDSMGIHEAIYLFETRVVNGSAGINCIQGLAIQVTSLSMILGALIWMSPRMSVAVLIAMALLFLPVRVADRKIVESATEQSNSLQSLSRKLIDSIKNLLLIQIYGTQELEERQAQSFLSHFRQHAMRLLNVGALKFAMPQFIGVILVCVITMVAQDRAGFAPGILVSYFYLVIQLLQGLSGLNITMSGAMGALPEGRKLYEWWENNSYDGPNPPKRRIISMAPRPADAKPIGWNLDGVCFTYPKTTKPIITNLSLRLDPGEVLAVTGSSGAGKSTLINLLLGGITPDRGVIDVVLPNGELTALEPYRNQLLPLIGYVGPEDFMLEGTLWDNLIYGLPSLPSQELIDEALEKAECGFVKSLAGGLRYRLTEQGQGLSAGQKQRLALTRALLRRPTVLILDEATSNLDADTEEKLVDTFARLKGEMTIVISTHRKALLRIADRQLSLSSESPEAAGVAA